MSTVAVAYESKVTVVETITADFVGADNTITFDGMNSNGTLTAATSVPATKHAEFTKAMSAGAGTIDLAALPGRTSEETVVGTGLKVQLMKLRNKSTNANKITVSNGGSNPYRLDGATTAWSITLAPGQAVLLELNETADDVAGGHKEIDLAGTLAQVLEVMIVLG